MIDLRSDTVTKPSEEMLDFMKSSQFGDDVYGEDPTVNELQEYVANLFGKEAGLFVPTGTMSNQVSLGVLTNPGEEVIADANAHIFIYENGAPSRWFGIQIMPIPSEDGAMPIEKIEQAIRPDVYYLPKTSVIELENTHNRHGGTILSLDYIKSVYELAQKNNIKMHLDGARIWNAHVATKTPLSEYGKYFDTVNVCFSKGLGAPVGSMVLSSHENIKKAWKIRKTLGGGMRQVGVLAAAAKFAIVNNLHKLIDDHKKAVAFSLLMQKSGLFRIDEAKVQTNIVMVDLLHPINILDYVAELKQQGLLINAISKNRLRAVFHLNNSMHDASEAANIMTQVAKSFIDKLN